ncbi:MAG: MerR family transcriptional regulator [Thermodesulfobacteriota bacterium]
MDAPALPNKPYFRIGEVAELLGVETHVLRYWENEFPHLSPTRAPSGQRLYRRPDVAKLLIIRRLLYAEGYTIAGARRKLEELEAGEPPAAAPSQASLFGAAPSEPGPDAAAPAPPRPEVVGEVLSELKDLLRILS